MTTASGSRLGSVDPAALSELVALALGEDIGPGDVTAEATVPPDARASALIVQKAPGVVFGFAAAAEAFRQTGAGELELIVAEGAWHGETPLELARITGHARAILAAERVALNLLSHLSGIATLTCRYVEAARPGGARILDTRKTIPGLRLLAKEAVAAGGGTNHRLGLYDAILIKENHAALAGGVAEAVALARTAQPQLGIEVEVRDAQEVQQALAARADRLLLDNMEFPGLRFAVAARDAFEQSDGHRAELEASGGVSLEDVAGISDTGVDFISVGALTHSAPALDLSLLLK